MNLIKTTIIGLCFELGYFSTQCIAGTMGSVAPILTNLPQFEISAAGGPNWFNTQDSELVISPFETDSALVNSIKNQGTWKVGIGAYLFDEYLSKRTYFNQFLVEANVYQASGSIRGDVWQFQDPEFNNYSFNAPWTSTRLMLDFKPTLMIWERLTPYLILGIGATWNTMSYDEKVTDIETEPKSKMFLGNKTVSQLAGDLGAGLRVNITKRISATAEYVYAFLGDGVPSRKSATSARLDVAPHFSFRTQSVLFGLSVAVF